MLRKLDIYIIAIKSHGKTKKSRQNKKATAKQKSQGKNEKSHGKTKQPRQNKKLTVKQKSHGKIKK